MARHYNTGSFTPPSVPTHMLGKVFNAVMNLAMFRAGPQDFPYDPRIGGVLVPLAVLVGYGVEVMVYPPVVAAAMALALVMGLAVAVRLLLRMRELDARFQQTYHALLAINTLSSLALWPAVSAMAPLLRRMAEGPVDAGMPTVDVPAGPVLLVMLVTGWNFAVHANIFGHAANLGFWRGALVALMVALSLQMFVYMFAALAAGLTGATLGN